MATVEIEPLVMEGSAQEVEVGTTESGKVESAAIETDSGKIESAATETEFGKIESAAAETEFGKVENAAAVTESVQKSAVSTTQSAKESAVAATESAKESAAAATEEPPLSTDISAKELQVGTESEKLENVITESPAPEKMGSINSVEELEAGSRRLKLVIPPVSIKGQRLAMDSINQMEYEEFTKIFGNVVENCPNFAASIWGKLPFYNVKSIHGAFAGFIDSLPSLAQEGILRSHPDLAGRLAQQKLLTEESTKEQAAAELNTLTPKEKSTLTDLNDRYKRKFGFPFVICARENKKNAILTGINCRLRHSLMDELVTGITEVKKIAFYRLLDIVEHTEQEGILMSW